jgi:hypothetical protein
MSSSSDRSCIRPLSVDFLLSTVEFFSTSTFDDGFPVDIFDAATVCVFDEVLVILNGFFRGAGPTNSTLLTLPSLFELLEHAGFLLAEDDLIKDSVFLVAFAEEKERCAFLFFAVYPSEEE